MWSPTTPHSSESRARDDDRERRCSFRCLTAARATGDPGVAANAIELHPVLAFRCLSG
jgi:hypothetical protein